MTSAGMPISTTRPRGRVIGRRSSATPSCRRRRSWRGRRDDRWSPTTWQPTIRRTARASSPGGTTSWAPSARASALLVRVAGADDDARVGHVADEPGDGGEAHRAGAEHGDDRLVGVARRRRPGGHQRGVDAAGERLDEHRRARRACRRRCGGAGSRGPRTTAPSRRRSSSRSRSGCRARGGRWRGGRSRRRRRGRRRRTAAGSRAPRGRAPARARPGCRRRAWPTTSWPGTNGKLTQSSK